MPDEQSDNDLFHTDLAAPAAPASPPAPAPVVASKPAPPSALSGLKAKFEALVHAHFPDLNGGGFEAHQPLRNFLLDMHALLP